MISRDEAPRETRSSSGFSGRRVLVIAEGDNPSLAYFVRPWLQKLAAEVIVVDSRKPPENIPGSIDAAVVVRYLPSCWRPVLGQLRAAGFPVAYFMDDDLMDFRAQSGLPLRYRWKILRLALWQRSAIESLCSEFRVSTFWLEAKYAKWSPQVLDACADSQTAPRDNLRNPHNERDESGVTVCYHGTASHAAEQRWLLPLIRELQSINSQTHFSIVGGNALRKMYRGIPRVTVIPPMGWPEYLAWTSTQGCDIALAPLVPGPFNAARAPTKFLDFARMGAVGIYADATPYLEYVRHGIDGVLVGMRKEDWLAALLALAADPARRAAMAGEARRRVLAQAFG